MLPPKPADDLGNERVFKKLGKSLIAYKAIKVGEVITLEHLSGRIYSTQFIPVRESNKVIGKIATRNILKDELINFNDISE